MTAVANVKVADGNTTAANVPTVAGTIYANPADPGTSDDDVAAFIETYDSSAAGSGKTLTPSGIVNDGNGGQNYSYAAGTFVTSPAGQIRPAAVASLTFTAQPVDTEVSTPVYSNCVAAPSGNPCQLVPTSSPVQVTAKDAFGNLAGPGAPGADALNAAISISIRQGGAAGAVLSSGVSTAAGIASFGNGLTIGATTLGTTLYAATGATINATSSGFQVVNDLEACVGLTCDNKAASGGSITQTTFGKIKSGNNFNNTVTLTTQFLSKVLAQNPDANRCVNPQNAPALGQMTEVKVQGGGVSATQPNFTMVMIYPKKTLQADDFSSRGTDKFNVCLGATWLDTGTATPWRAKTSLTNAALTNAQEVVAGSKVYLGLGARLRQPDCDPASDQPLHRAPDQAGRDA